MRLLRRLLLVIVISLVILAGILLTDYEMPEITTESITVFAFVLLAILAVVSAFISEWLSGENGGINTKAWWADFTQGLSTEMVGALLTGVLFVFVVGAVEERQAEEQWQKELIFRMGSPNNSVAVEAARTLDAEGWLTDGSLREANLTEANLERARLILADLVAAILIDADLEGAKLNPANLQSADLTNATLEGAWLIGATLENATLEETNLQRAFLSNANLRGADLDGANMARAFLRDADLQGASLTDVTWITDGGLAATLPDGNAWTPETDLGRFTDPDHPSFWRSTSPDSPAYVGDSTGE